MNKLIPLTIYLCLTSTAILAEETIETCANGGGTVITGTISEHRYCLSNNTMNWWNAISWCDGLGQKLFSLNDCKCDDRTQNCTAKCPELAGVRENDEYRTWTTTPFSTTLAYFVKLSSGNASANTSPYGDHSNSYSHRALCK